MPEAGGVAVDECGGDVTGGHFNPTFKTAPFTPGDQLTYEVGDFSGKFGNLAGGIGVNNDSLTYLDEAASILYDPEPGSRGRMWIVGRSIVIHKATLTLPLPLPYPYPYR